MHLHWVDIAIIVVIGLSVLTGLFRGFVKELIALCAWGLAIWFGFKYSQSLDPWLTPYIQEQSIRSAAAFIIILFATLLAGGIVNAVLSFILKRSGLNGTDRTLGMGFGFIRGVFIVALLMVAVKMTSLPYEQYAHESKLYTRFDPVVAVIYEHLPAVIKQVKTVDTTENVIDTQKDVTLLVNG
ncbi:CvpA family protein [Legionella sp. km772]|uniref:CvpA family protein n=1 Tax=Legionella sp. km772 TaxID=2498111 RepID=UPI000F8DFDF7|nr:CvpA family protein [Legionella sp. km772]RUR09592.1 CvpA family protein [Legionella sp. km772]